MKTKIHFEKRAVAFIDILGFKNLVDYAQTTEAQLETLNDLVDLLNSAIPNLNSGVNNNTPKNLIPKHIYISDCIILSAPLKDESRPTYCGLNTIIMRTIQISHRILDAGYLISGGISIGNAWHTESNIIGHAYQEAYLIESTNRIPCVRLSSSAKDIFTTRNISGTSNMCIPHKDYLIVNGVHEYYMPNSTNFGGINDTYEKYNAIIQEKLNSNIPLRAKRKWRWFMAYLNKLRVSSSR